MAMKLGTETGSMNNYLLSGTVGAPVPCVGMGATILCWTDRHAATIVKVTATQVHVQRDKATRVDRNGQSESQTYEFERDPEAPVEVFRLTKRGWKGSRGYLRIGDRKEYCDPGF